MLHALAAAARAQDVSCRGDCNGNSAVTIDELIAAVDIALGNAPESACPAFPGCPDIDIACLVGAVNSALDGCPAPPTETPSLTPTGPSPITPTPSLSPTVAPTPTVTPGRGPVITFFGLATAEGHMLPTAGVDPQGIPIYPIGSSGSGFLIVAESKPGSSGRPPGVNTFNSNPSDPGARPDMQIEANQNLGNGSPQVCDAARPNIGGVPGINPPSFDPASQMIADALNDLGCRFLAHTSSDPCTIDDNENPAFLAAGTSTQLCSSPVFGHETAFPQGDTLVTMQWKDTGGNFSLPTQIIVHVP